MASTKKRAYHSKAREAQASETKERILSSAKKLFESEGFSSVTIEQLAEDAKVSAPTIYSLFQSKQGLLRALMDEALPSEQRLALVEEDKLETSPQKKLLITAKIARQMYDAERAQMAIFRSASILSPEFKELEQEREERRYKRQEESFKMLVAKNCLKEGLPPSKAQEILWALSGRDLYRMFVIERGWSSDEYEVWLGELLIQSLLGS